MSKKIEDLTLQEAKDAQFDIKMKKKVLDLNAIQLKDRKKFISTEKKKIREQKAKRMATLQEEITKANGKTAKDSKRKTKARESASFDNRIASKDREIDDVERRISQKAKDKAQLNIILEKLKHHIENIK